MIAKQDILPLIGHRVTVTYRDPVGQGLQSITGLLAVVSDDGIGLYVTSNLAPRTTPTYIQMSDIVAVQNAWMETVLQAGFLGMPVWGWLVAGTLVAVGMAFWKPMKRK